MKRKGITIQHLQNAEHFEFHADVLAEIGKTTPAPAATAEDKTSEAS
ncbi:MAG: hypothetical protein LBU98_01505 [Alistipes sp.]|jgi:hypothetical protein|nr:hypothetical protein [Alistipes sp.]